MPKSKQGARPHEDVPEGGSPSQDRSGRFSVDALIRAHGFEIRSRKNNEEPVWRLWDRDYTQSEVLELLPNKEVIAARMKEDDYHFRRGL